KATQLRMMAIPVHARVIHCSCRVHAKRYHFCGFYHNQQKLKSGLARSTLPRLSSSKAYISQLKSLQHAIRFVSLRPRALVLVASLGVGSLVFDDSALDHLVDGTEYFADLLALSLAPLLLPQ